MCRDADCPVDDEPPAGEAWCVYRLGLEYARWVFGYPMQAGLPGPVVLATGASGIHWPTRRRATPRRRSAAPTTDGPADAGPPVVVGGGWGI